MYPGGTCSFFLSPAHAQISEMRITVESLEKERDFYYGKLRQIEMLCQEKEEEMGELDDSPTAQLISTVLEVLYAKEVSPDSALRNMNHSHFRIELKM